MRLGIAKPRGFRGFLANHSRRTERLTVYNNRESLLFDERG